MRQIIICLILAVGLIGPSLLSVPVSGQTPDNLLAQRITLQINKGTFLYALSTLSVDKRVPIGFEVALNHKDEYNLNIDVKSATLQDVLDKIMLQEPGYRWEMRDGVINIVPYESRDDFVEKLLNTSVREFTPPKVLEKFQIRDAIIELPEVVSLLKANGIIASRYAYSYRYPSIYTDETVDLTITKTDVRGVLNKVIKDSEHKMWMISRSGNKLTSLDISF